jgi:hypothetical protein
MQNRHCRQGLFFASTLATKNSQQLNDCRIMGREATITRRQFLKASALGGTQFIALLHLPLCLLASPGDYSRLVEFIGLADVAKPLFVFRDFQEEFDAASHKANLEYFAEHPDLMTKIYQDLGSDEVRWKLDNLIHRLVFVPERREEYASLYESYCRDVIGYILDKTKLKNPFLDIRTLQEEKPEMPQRGVTACLVHNLAKEFVARYVFFGQDSKKISIELTGKIFSTTVGSYTTNIYLREDGKFAFEKDRYTLWQNSAANPYTALMVPAEETLHVGVREHTNRAIREQLTQNLVNSVDELQNFVQEWIAVEVALVGGLVYALLPHFLSKHLRNLPPSSIDEDMEFKSRLQEYRYLPQGIELVKRFGIETALNMHANEPARVKELLM